MAEVADPIYFHRREALVHLSIANAIEMGTLDALLAYEHAHVPAAWVAERLGITPQAANNRLSKLERLGICRRRARIVAGGGRLWEYHWIAKIGEL